MQREGESLCLGRKPIPIPQKQEALTIKLRGRAATIFLWEPSENPHLTTPASAARTRPELGRAAPPLRPPGPLPERRLPPAVRPGVRRPGAL